MSENDTGTDDAVLSDDEKDALIDGVATGEVEVLTDTGHDYASVTEFEVTPRNRILTNSFPRLQSINRKLAGYIGKSASKLLNEKIEVAPAAMTTPTWGEFGESCSETALLFEFAPKPLEGAAVVHLQKSVIGHVVETFYGGSKENPPRHEADNFTPGEMNVVSLFCEDVIKGIQETWQGLAALAPEKTGVHQSTDIVEIIENSQAVIVSEYDIHFEAEQYYFHIVWPTSTLASLLPVLEGQKRDRDPVEDARWEQVIRACVPNAIVGVSSHVGNACMSLREVASLDVGDVIEIDNPRAGTVFADRVPVLEGRFGVHDGCYAIEATRWLSAAADTA